MIYYIKKAGGIQMKYYILMFDFESADNWVACNDNYVGGINYLEMYHGVPFKGWKEDFYFGYDPKDGVLFTDNLSNAEGWLTVSKKFKDLTEKLIQNEVQYFPIKIINTKDQTENHDYTVLNIIDLVDGLDLENSIYRVIRYTDNDGKECTHNSIQKFALKKEIVEGHHLFRLKGQTISVFVSEALKDVIVKNNMIGFDFLEVKVS